MSVRGNSLPQISLGDIVTVIDDEGKLPRSQWKLGKIEELIKGDDEAIGEPSLESAVKERNQCKLAALCRCYFPLK